MTDLPFEMTPGQAEDAAVQLEQDIIGIVREEIGMHEQMATVFAQALVRGLRRRLGGQELYIPSPNRAERDAAIRREFNGTNIDALMKRHGIGRARVYQIVGRRAATLQPSDGRQAQDCPVSPLKSGHESDYGDAS